jgi:hypothetical protein
MSGARATGDAMPRIRITQYQVSTLRFAGAGEDFRFTLHLSGVAESGSVNRVSIAFGDNADPDQLGRLSAREVSVNLPDRAFSRLLRHPA